MVVQYGGRDGRGGVPRPRLMGEVNDRERVSSSNNGIAGARRVNTQQTRLGTRLHMAGQVAAQGHVTDHEGQCQQ